MIPLVENDTRYQGTDLDLVWRNKLAMTTDTSHVMFVTRTEIILEEDVYVLSLSKNSRK